MKTAFHLKRKFLTGEVRQNSKTKMFSASDMVKIANHRRAELNRPKFNLSAYLKNASSLEFIEELQNEYPDQKIISVTRGRNAGTWVHPLLFIDIALSIDPKLKIRVYKWIYDELVRYRNDSGSSYKKMVGALYQRDTNKQSFQKKIVKIAKYIREKCNVKDWNKATEDELKLRDTIHNNISLLCDVLRDSDQAVRIGVDRAIKEYKETNKTKSK